MIFLPVMGGVAGWVGYCMCPCMCWTLHDEQWWEFSIQGGRNSLPDPFFLIRATAAVRVFQCLLLVVNPLLSSPNKMCCLASVSSTIAVIWSSKKLLVHSYYWLNPHLFLFFISPWSPFIIFSCLIVSTSCCVNKCILCCIIFLLLSWFWILVCYFLFYFERGHILPDTFCLCSFPANLNCLPRPDYIHLCRVNLPLLHVLVFLLASFVVAPSGPSFQPVHCFHLAIAFLFRFLCPWVGLIPGFDSCLPHDLFRVSCLVFFFFFWI